MNDRWPIISEQYTPVLQEEKFGRLLNNFLLHDSFEVLQTSTLTGNK
jgi:hypothetical protein